MDNCRIYVCKSIFGQKDECMHFIDFLEYTKWLKNPEKNKDNTVFVPICNCNEILDKFRLMIKSKKLNIPKIHHIEL